MKEPPFDELEQAASAGDPDAQHRVGQMYLTGRYYNGAFIPQDKTKAESLFRDAALNGHIQARDRVQIKDREEKNKIQQQRMDQISRSVGALILIIIGVAISVFVVLGVVGLLWFGIRHLF